MNTMTGMAPNGAANGRFEEPDRGARGVPEIAISLLGGDELRKALKLLRQLLEDPAGFREVDLIGQLRDPAHGAAYKSVVLYLNRSARELEHAVSPAFRVPALRGLKHLHQRLIALEDEESVANARPAAEAASRAPEPSVEDAIRMVYETTVWRTPGAAEIAVWKENLDNGLPFHEFMGLMSRSSEAARFDTDIASLHSGSAGHFVQLAHEHTQNRGAGAPEINHWLLQIETGTLSRTAVLSQLFMAGVNWSAAMEAAAPHDGLSCRIMGTNRDLTATQWERQAEQMTSDEAADGDADSSTQAPRDSRYGCHFHIRRPPQVLVSAITSLYRGGRFIEQFMDNITSQEGFPEYCELVIVDADSPDGESAIIERYLSSHPNINYMRINHRIGIYDAWNVAAQAARGEYLTNANLDDLRRGDSFMLQAGTLDALPFVDVVYQDLYYTFDPDLPFEKIAAFGHQTALPVITLHNLVQFNSPHNAPMWRKSLHEELGYFDTNYRSAGDYEFWFRCLAAGKKFYKINDPHVAYYQNPNGLSTRPDSRGLVEALDIHKRYCRKMMPEEVVMPTIDFLGALYPEGGGQVPNDRYRYAMAQEALRRTARRRKFGGDRA